MTAPTPDQLLDTLHDWQTGQGQTDATMLTLVIEAAALGIAGELRAIREALTGSSPDDARGTSRDEPARDGLREAVEAWGKQVAPGPLDGFSAEEVAAIRWAYRRAQDEVRSILAAHPVEPVRCEHAAPAARCPAESRGLCAEPYCDGTAPAPPAVETRTEWGVRWAQAGRSGVYLVPTEATAELVVADLTADGATADVVTRTITTTDWTPLEGS